MRRRFAFSLAELTYAIVFLAACTAAGARISWREPERARTLEFSSPRYALDIIAPDLLGGDPAIIPAP